MNEGETAAPGKEEFREISGEGINDDTSRISFTLTVLEEAADAHTQALTGVQGFQRMAKEKKMKSSDNSYKIEFDDVLHLIATAKQMRLALRLAADEASSTAARETALDATRKFETELEGAKKAFMATAKLYENQLEKEELELLLDGGDNAVNLVKSKDKGKSAEEKQLESKEAANSLKRVTSMIMESIYSIEAANDLLDQDEDSIARTNSDLDSYKNEASSADKTLARIKAKEQRARYELYAAFAFFLVVVFYVLIRRIPFLAFFFSLFGSSKSIESSTNSNNIAVQNLPSSDTPVFNTPRVDNVGKLETPTVATSTSENMDSTDLSIANFEKENEEKNKYFLKKKTKI